jgi:hypothetical protein
LAELVYLITFLSFLKHVLKECLKIGQNVVEFAIKNIL